MKVHRSKRGTAAYPLIESAEALTFGVIRLRFDDGYQADLDLRPLSGAIWANIRTEQDFFAMEIDDIGSRFSWPKGNGLTELPADGLRFECERRNKSVH
jgi:hypothetical protein